LTLQIRGGEASQKKAADLYLSLLRNCNGRVKTWHLLYLSLCTINISHLFDSIWVAETYAHISFLIQYKFPTMKFLSALLLQMAWRIAKSQKNAHLVWLLFATAHRNLRKGNFRDAELYLGHLLSSLKKLNADDVDTIRPGASGGRSLERMGMLAYATVQWGLGDLSQALFLVQETEKACRRLPPKSDIVSDSSSESFYSLSRSSSSNSLSSMFQTNELGESSELPFCSPSCAVMTSSLFRTSSFTSLSKTDKASHFGELNLNTNPPRGAAADQQLYVDSLCVRWGTLLGAQCLIEMDRNLEALSLLKRLVALQKSEAPRWPTCSMERIALKGLHALVLQRLGQFRTARTQAEAALALSGNDQGNLQLFTWTVYPSFVEALVWEWERTSALKERHAARQMSKQMNQEQAEQSQISTMISKNDSLIEESDDTDSDEEDDDEDTAENCDGGLNEAEDKNYDCIDEASADSVPKLASEAIRTLKIKAQNVTCLLSTLQRLQGLAAYLSGDQKRASRCWEKSLQIARSMDRALDEAHALYEIGRHHPNKNCSCFNRNLHTPSCALAFLLPARELFSKCGANYLVKRSTILIQQIPA
jgi:hypothetical protein